MLAVQKGDRPAFETLVSRHIDALHGYALRLSRDGPSSDDLVQDTFLSAWEKSRSYKPGKVKLSTWLHRILHNKFIDHTRRNRWQRVAGDVDQIEDMSTPEATHRAHEDGERLEALLRSLPENQRAALVLAHAQGFNNQETAVILNTSVRAVESLLARARRTLRNEFAEEQTKANEVNAT
jgi:RNA polymerase sigma-70 factor (ECF subfamily)